MIRSSATDSRSELPRERRTGKTCGLVPRHAVAIAAAILLYGTGVLPSEPVGRLPFHQYIQQRWSLEQGLPQVTVADLAEDARGFLWVGTQDGLARFDGFEFEVFTSEGSPGLAGNNIVRLTFDDAGALWIGTRTGLTRFDGASFVELRMDGRSLGPVNAIHPVSDGLLVATDSGLFHAAGDTLSRVESVPESLVTFAAPTEGGGLLVGLPGLLRHVGTDRTVERPLGAGVIPKRFLHGCGGGWVATTSGLFRFDGQDASVFEPAGQRNVNALYCDPTEVLWVGTGNGLLRIRSGALLETAEDESRFAHPWVTAFVPGSDGSLWLGTHTGGLYRLSTGRFERYGRQAGLPFSVTFAVEASRRGGLWVGGQGGVAWISGDRIEALPGAVAEAGDRVVASLLEDSSGRLWAGTRSGLTRTDFPAGRTTNVFDSMVLALAGGPDDTVWIGGPSGLYAYRSGKLEKDSESEHVGRVRTLLLSERHGLVVGSEQGVFVRRPVEAVEGPFERLDASLFEDARRVGALFEETDGTLWAGYLGDGLARLGGDGKGWTLFTERDGLLSNTVYGVRRGRDGRLWISTQKGVLRVAPAAIDRVVRERGRADAAETEAHDPVATLEPDVVVSITGREPGATAGYCCSGGTSSAILLDGQGALWVPTLDGALRFDTAQEQPQRSAPHAALVALVHAGRTYRFDEGAPAVLPGDERDIEVVFTAPVFDKPEQTRFRYRLDGYDTQWREARGRRSASYTNLPGGTYTFRVQADTGGPAGQDATWSFSIRHRFRETPWFWGLLVLIVIGGAWGAFTLRLRQLERHRSQLEGQVAERTIALVEANEALAQANHQLAELSYTDPLTALRNRRFLADHIHQDLSQILRLRDRPGDEDLAVVFLLIDVDHFKHVNDRFGHAAGDAVLVEIARRLRALARDSDHVVRWGGEELLFVVCGAPVQASTGLVSRVMTGLWAEPFPIPGGSPVRVTGSIGFSVFPFGPSGESYKQHDPLGWEAVVSLADRALYLVKQRGRNGWAGVLPGPRPGGALTSGGGNRALSELEAAGAVRLVSSFGVAD